MKNLQTIIEYVIELEKPHFEEMPIKDHIYINILRAREEIETLLAYTNHFAERMQDVLDTKSYPWGSGENMSEMLAEYEDWREGDCEKVEMEQKEAILAILQAEYDEAEENAKLELEDYNEGFKNGIEHVMRMVRENKI